MLKISTIKKYEGQTLVEIILAVAVAITVIVALVTLAVSAMRYAQSSMMRSVGEKLAAGGIEGVRIVRSSDPTVYDNKFATNISSYWKIVSTGLDPCVTESGCASNFCKISYGNYNFCRKIAVGQDTGNHRDVFVEVRWQEGAGERKVYLSSRIYKY